MTMTMKNANLPMMVLLLASVSGLAQNGATVMQTDPTALNFIPLAKRYSGGLTVFGPSGLQDTGTQLIYRGVVVGSSAGTVPYVSVTTQAGNAYTIQPGDCTQLGTAIIFTSSTGAAVTLPTTGLTSGCQVTIKNLTAAGQALTVAPASGTIDGSASLAPIYFPGDALLVWTGTTWNAFGGFGVRGAGSLNVPYAVPYVSPTLGSLGAVSVTGLVKYSATGVPSAAVAGTDYQAPLAVTTTGTSGAATLSGNTLNIPQYGTGSGTVNSGTAGQVAVYSTSGAAVSGVGTLPSAVLPVFVGSGASHAIGAVPDPGATVGTTRYLREDGTFATANATQVNGAAVPANLSLAGTNSLGQLVNGSGTLSTALTAGNGLNGTGDSLGAATGASVYTNGFMYLLRQPVGGYFRNASRPSDMCMDLNQNSVASAINPDMSGTYPITVMECGTNDTTIYNSTTGLQSFFQRVVTGNIYWAGIASRFKAIPAFSLTGFTSSGSFSGDTSGYQLAPFYASTTNGNTLTYTVTATASQNIPVVGYEAINGNGGTFTLSVDGTAATDPIAGTGTTFYNSGDAGAAINTTNGATQAIIAVRLPALSVGSHTITLTVTSATSGSNRAGLNWIALVPPTSPANPTVLQVSPNHQNNANDTLSGTYAGFESAIVTQARTDGLNAYYADTRTASVNTPVSVGLNVAVPTTSYTPPTWVSDVGVVYAGSNIPLTKVSSGPTVGQYAVSGSGTYTFSLADSATALKLNFVENCGATLTAVYANCYIDTLHPNDYLHALMAATILSTLPAAVVTGNSVPNPNYPFRNYVGYGLAPSQMMTPNAYNLDSTATQWAPGLNIFSNVGQSTFITHTPAYGMTVVVPNIGSSNPTFSICSYNSTTSGQPQGTAALNFCPLTVTGNGLVTWATPVNIFQQGLTTNRTIYTTPVTIFSNASPNIVGYNGLQTITLSANATATMNSLTTGARITIEICQPASGGPYTFTWPAAIHGGMTIGTTASTCSIQSFDSFNGSSYVAESAGISGVAP